MKSKIMQCLCTSAVAYIFGNSFPLYSQETKIFNMNQEGEHLLKIKFVAEDGSPRYLQFIPNSADGSNIDWKSESNTRFVYIRPAAHKGIVYDSILVYDPDTANPDDFSSRNDRGFLFDYSQINQEKILENMNRYYENSSDKNALISIFEEAKKGSFALGNWYSHPSGMSAANMEFLPVSKTPGKFFVYTHTLIYNKETEDYVPIIYCLAQPHNPKGFIIPLIGGSLNIDEKMRDASCGTFDLELLAFKSESRLWKEEKALFWRYNVANDDYECLYRHPIYLDSVDKNGHQHVSYFKLFWISSKGSFIFDNDTLSIRKIYQNLISADCQEKNAEFELGVSGSLRYAYFFDSDHYYSDNTYAQGILEIDEQGNVRVSTKHINNEQQKTLLISPLPLGVVYQDRLKDINDNIDAFLNKTYISKLARRIDYGVIKVEDGLSYAAKIACITPNITIKGQVAFDFSEVEKILSVVGETVNAACEDVRPDIRVEPINSYFETDIW